MIKARVETGFTMAWDDYTRTEWAILFVGAECQPGAVPLSAWEKSFTRITSLKIVVEFESSQSENAKHRDATKD